ncbi:MAG: tryptophan synthase subunit alpha [bacterium]|nr:tryptophan synthase subunit alpha [bacterium]
MSRIAHMFARLKAEDQSGFIAYIVAGDPTLEITRALVPELERRGVDLIELGVPFSDPMADGIAIQEGAQRALRNNVSLEDILNLVEEIRAETQIPLVFMTYFNPVYRYGLQRFADRAKAVGVDGVLAVDLPPEEAVEYKQMMDGRGLDTIFLVAPTSRDDRIRLISSCTTGFVYYVSSMGVTGERERLADTIGSKVKQIRTHTSNPVAVGFGISRPDQVREVAGYADAVVVGSAIVRRVGAHEGEPDLVSKVGAFVETLVQPLREGVHGSG